MNCPYCNKRAERVTGSKVHPHRPWLAEKQFFQCEPCNAYVGCHDNGHPFGTLANSELRLLRIKAHQAFDPVWKTGRLTRKRAYKWLAKKLGVDSIHIGQMNSDQCKRTIELGRGMRYKTTQSGQ